MSDEHDTVSGRAPEPVGAFPHAKRVGNLLFLSGIGPRVRGTKEIPGVTFDADGNVVDYDITAQTRQVFENVRTVLEDRMLHAELDDYPEYAKQTRYRLLPGIW